MLPFLDPVDHIILKREWVLLCNEVVTKRVSMQFSCLRITCSECRSRIDCSLWSISYVHSSTSPAKWAS